MFSAFEFKYNENRKVRFSKTFTNTYPNTDCVLISSANYENFLIMK